ncbi:MULTISPECIES: hypothetical protein [unclassified Sedimentibacter]|uniref:hypothetical protein n=1 Tax=unclassified Sedimentibacter TaxID=2649220 RepID=UPI001BD4C338|nr:hypothetical protein [Sedimentibacter sp. MB35-C1]WMJ77068.1 hypothetical protein RBQ61_16065 [Sedimentibacter sp. MB35-C1]
MIILEEIVTSAKHAETNKNVKFPLGFIRVSEQEGLREWEGSMQDIEDYGPLLDLFNSNKPSEFEFVCKKGKVFKGKIAVTGILVSDVLFKGVGALKYGEEYIVD